MTRHALSTRLWHWLNALSVIVLFMSGLNISNAHPHLYWGQWGFDPKDSWMAVAHFPGWATIPGYYSLASARDWHVLFAWVFALSLLLFMLAALLNGHFRRDIVTGWKDWRPGSVWADVRSHLRGHFDAVGAKYNFLQKAAYGFVLFILLPLMLLTGLAISPGMDAAWPFLLDVFGGLQSARSVHFVVAWSLFAFLLLHLVLLLLHRPLRNTADMISGGHADEAA